MDPDPTWLAPTCDECGKTKEWVSEPLVSGFRGFVCKTSGCPVD